MVALLMVARRSVTQPLNTNKHVRNYAHTHPPTHTSTSTNTRVLCAYLQWNIPGHVDVALVLVHPDLSHPQSVTTHVGSQVLCVGFVGALDVRNPGTGQDLHAAATLPHLSLQTQRYTHIREF